MAAPERTPAKREQIVNGALAVFRESGFAGASVDAIAARAGVSKATVYSHFKSKEALFVAVVELENEATRARFMGLLEAPTGDLEADLRRVGEQLVRLACSPASILRYRAVSAEAGRFPEVCHSLYECNILAGRGRLAAFIGQLGELGQLEVADAEVAAIDFTSLCLDNARVKLLLGVVPELTDELVEAEVTRAVRAFVRAYGVRAGA